MTRPQEELAQRMTKITALLKENPMKLSKEDIKCIQMQFYDENEAEKIAEAYMAMKKESPDIFTESVKIDVALANKTEMPPKKWATNPYFPRR